MTRLDRRSLNGLPADCRPGYDPDVHAIGILHLGLGAFHRAHQAVYTDSALAHEGGDWRIAAVSLRSVETVDALGPQDGLYTLIERGADGERARVIGSIGSVLAATRELAAVIGWLANPSIRIVTLTVTEKAYGFDRAAMDIDPDHSAIAADLRNPREPQGVIGLLVEGLRLRRAADLSPPTILCCDNLPENGALLRAGVLGFARRIDPELGDWIARETAFPSSMVDRITPSPTAETRERARRHIGVEDAGAVETEPFAQWVIEDRFPTGRPSWDASGALFVDDVAPFERMKLRMLNGAHSLIAYAGFLRGHAYVRDAMADETFPVLVDRHLRAAARTVGELPGIDLDAYRRDLCERFANPAIAHETYQIAMDGTQKLPQRLFAPAIDAARSGDEFEPFAFALAAWMRYALGINETGETYDLRDPRGDEIADVVERVGRDVPAIVAGLAALPNFMPDELRANDAFLDAVAAKLSVMLDRGIGAAVEAEAS
ncbi:mannitol dehydrogenase family protein [Fulvimarina sp. MAC3]|uniref:mannitol dehydrogenase family protein n=1 Tax=Fulvimarina sp. MAC3 TaxID=3148887 RepID=UPI0031FD0E55